MKNFVKAEARFVVSAERWVEVRINIQKSMPDVVVAFFPTCFLAVRVVGNQHPSVRIGRSLHVCILVQLADRLETAETPKLNPRSDAGLGKSASQGLCPDHLCNSSGVCTERFVIVFDHRYSTRECFVILVDCSGSSFFFKRFPSFPCFPYADHVARDIAAPVVKDLKILTAQVEVERLVTTISPFSNLI
nr:hypothetical protein [Rhodopirellula sp. SM50]